MLLRNSHAWKTSQEPNRSLADVIRLSGRWCFVRWMTSSHPLSGAQVDPERFPTCLQRYRAIRLRCGEIQQFSSTDPLAEYHSTPLIRSVNMKDVLGDIQTDYDNSHTDASLKWCSTPPLWHIEPRRASTPHKIANGDAT